MDERSLWWGTRLGAIGAGLGVLSYLLGAVLIPWKPQQTTAEAVVLVVFVRALFVLVVLGVVLGLAYYAGLRIAREQLAQRPRETHTTTEANSRLPSVLSGGLVLLLYWFVTRLYVYVFPPFQRQSVSLQDLGGNFLLGLLFVCLGAGLGGLGARTATSRKLLENIVVIAPQPAPPAPLVSPREGVAEGPAPAAPDAERSPTTSGE